MIVDIQGVGRDVALLVSDGGDEFDAEQDFIRWAEENHCYVPTASEMEEDGEGRWTVRVMRRPLEEAD